MTQPIVILTPEQVASHIHGHSYKWVKGAQCGNWLVLIGPNHERNDAKPVVGAPDWYEYGYKEYAGEDQGGLWFENGKLVDEDGYERVFTPDSELGAPKLATVGRMLEALGMDAKSYGM